MLPVRYAGISAMFRMADISLARTGHDAGPGAIAGAGVVVTRMRSVAGFCYPGDMRSARLLLT